MIPLGSHVFNHPAPAGPSAGEADMLVAYLTLLAIFIGGGVSYAFQPKGRRPRLNVWYRTGLVLSGIWFFAFGLAWHFANVDNATRLYSARYRLCSDLYPFGEPGHDHCIQELGDGFHSQVMMSWGESALAAFIGVLSVWIAAYIVLWSTRWILNGRPKEAKA